MTGLSMTGLSMAGLSLTGLGASVRRSVGSRALVIMVPVAVLHVLLRPRPWRFDWGWALQQYGFVTTMLGPLCCGVAALDAARMSAATGLVDSAGRSAASLVRSASSSMAWVAVAYAAGLAVVAGFVVGAGGAAPGAWATFAALAPPLALLMTAATVGAAIGARIGRWWAAAVAAIGSYVALVMAFVSGHEVLIRVGGANGEIVSIVVRAAYVARQSLWFAVLAVAAVVVGSHRPAARVRPEARVELCVVAVVLAGVVATTGDSRMFEARRPDLRCDGGTPRLCVGPAYVRFAPGVRRRVAPVLAAWNGLGGPPVREMTMSASVRLREGVMSLPDDLVTGDSTWDDHHIAQLVTNATFRHCDGDPGERDVVDEAGSFRTWWLDQFVVGPNRFGSTADPWFERPVDEQRRWATDELQRLLDWCATVAGDGR